MNISTILTTELGEFRQVIATVVTCAVISIALVYDAKKGNPRNRQRKELEIKHPLQDAYKRLALAKSQHKRLGENSTLAILPVDIVEVIARVEQVKTILSVKFSIPVDKVKDYTRQMTVLDRTDKVTFATSVQ